MTFENAYNDTVRASAYATMRFPGTYELAFRHLPEIITRQVLGRNALDFGCGAGRSTRFLRELGFKTCGIDISSEMLEHAWRLDPKGDYRLVNDGEPLPLPENAFDLVFSAFTFDNVPTSERKGFLFAEIGRVLREGGRWVNLVSTPEIYTHEWVSFTTQAFPENHGAKPGDPVRIVNLASGEGEPVTDILCPDETYRALYAETGLELLEMRKLLARSDEAVPWVNETRIAPWCVYIMRPAL